MYVAADLHFACILTTTNGATKATMIHKKGKLDKIFTQFLKISLPPPFKPKNSQPHPYKEFMKITSTPAARRVGRNYRWKQRFSLWRGR